MINITQQPTNFYPVYNDSFIKFNTTFNENDRAIITLDNTYQFTLFPDAEGTYLFNMREVAKALINPTQFKDTVDNSGEGWGFADESLYKEISVTITAYGDESSETISNTYSFTKAVKQYGDSEFLNDYQLMLPSNDGINYHMTYFEGFPMEIPFRYVEAGDSITIKNKRTEQVTIPFIPTSSAPYRLFVDKAVTNWHSAGVLEIPDMMNRMDIRIDGVVMTSIELTKYASRCGKYLKWFNSDGSYSYWLFHQWYKQDYAGKEIDRIGTNNYSNIYGNKEGITKLSGKSGASGIKLKTIVTEDEKNHLISLITSPMVQLWSSEDPYADGQWISVKVVSNGFSYSNKRVKNQIEVDIELPNINTQVI